MTHDTEAVLDRRSLRRRLGFWRAAGIVGIALAIGAFALGGQEGGGLIARHQIARISIDGLITENREQLKMLQRIGDASRVDALLVFVNSPGGTTTGGEALFEGLRAVAKKKPVVAQFGTVAASAGYIVGLATDHIVTRGNTITGSVGVIMQWPEVSALLDKLGVKMNEIKSGPLKAAPSPFAPIDEPARKVTEQMIAEGFQWFRGLVESRRGVKTADIGGLEQGRIFSGREAVSLKLADEIGGEAEAVRWLKEQRGVKHGLKVIDWKPRHDSDWMGLTSQSGLAGLALRNLAATLMSALGVVRDGSGLSLDGLVSVWHPSEN